MRPVSLRRVASGLGGLQDVARGRFLQLLDKRRSELVGQHQLSVGNLLIDDRRVDDVAVDGHDHDAVLVLRRDRAEIDLAFVVELQMHRARRILLHANEILFRHFRQATHQDFLVVRRQVHRHDLERRLALPRSLDVDPQKDLRSGAPGYSGDHGTEQNDGNQAYPAHEFSMAHRWKSGKDTILRIFAFWAPVGMKTNLIVQKSKKLLSSFWKVDTSIACRSPKLPSKPSRSF